MRGESEVPGGSLNLISTDYPDHGHHGHLPLSRKNAHGRPVIEPGTSWLVVRSSDHQATRLVAQYNVSMHFFVYFMTLPILKTVFCSGW